MADLEPVGLIEVPAPEPAPDQVAELVASLGWALKRINTSLDIGAHYFAALAVLEKARGVHGLPKTPSQAGAAS